MAKSELWASSLDQTGNTGAELIFGRALHPLASVQVVMHLLLLDQLRYAPWAVVLEAAAVEGKGHFGSLSV